MSRVYVQCVLCGAPFVGTGWLGECRSVYTRGHEWSKSYLSGVGIKDIMHSALCLVPVDPKARYDDPDYGTTPKLRLGTVPLFEENRNIFDPNMRIEKEPWGFFFHEHCWGILCEAAYPREIPIHTLKEIFMSCPASYCGIDWGNGYGGIYGRLLQGAPGSSGFLGRLKDLEWRPNGRPDYMNAVWRFDPLRIAEIEELLEESCSASNKQRKVDTELNSEIRSYPESKKSPLCDPLTTLPPEIRETILILLPSQDVCNLRAASRAFASLQLSNDFWASRFSPGFEFSFVFESRRYLENRLSSVSWKMLYDGINECSAIRSMRNRRRIWGLMLPLAQTLIYIVDHPLKGIPAPTFYNPGLPQTGIRWRFTSSSKVLHGHQRDAACRALHSRMIDFDDAIDGAYVSFVKFSGKEYVSGMQFVLASGKVAEIGYILPQKRIYLNIKRHSGQFESNLQGFCLAVMQTGIGAIALVSSTGKLSQWAGLPNGIPLGLLVAHGSHISSLRAYFDVSIPTPCLQQILSLQGCKMVSLGIPHKGKAALPLRDTELWFPEIPREKSNLVPGWRNSPSHYCPLLYLDFGGQNGIYLTNIVSVSLLVSRDSNIPKAIKVEYDRPISGSKVRILDKGGIYNSDAQYDSLVTQGIKFAIDGASGEYITRVDIGHIYGDLESFADFNVSSNLFPSRKE
ncbi:conserved hypothetical protein [Paecilomyces variotii No. 5]|uniref:F-box domain-containing protein n=1 Tax=Byssochlamys spectabilis (strain No. 5 / NBRC 109023) TaxID=1356009 RepID=V5FHR4_BYSSN|nr:conserved hypothetical protein [Paecilomyces variotii No. 5]